MLNNCPSIEQWSQSVPQSAKWPTFVGTVILLGWALGFGVWSTHAPIDGAVVAPGTFVATGQNKQIQHLEGGIIREIMVSEGDLVEPGQLLLRLDDTASRAKERMLDMRALRHTAMKARLRAEAQGIDSWQPPEELQRLADNSDVKDVIERQQTEHAARLLRRRDEEGVLRREIDGLNENISGYRAQIKATEEQLASFKLELDDKRDLLERQLTRRDEVHNLERAQARLSGDLGQLLSRVADAKERIARCEQQIAQIRSAAIQKSVEELRLTETELDDLNEQLRAARDVTKRVDIQAPVRGIVVKLNYHTSGGVVAPGATILEMLPVNDELIIESRIMPTDIVHVKEGQRAEVRLSALSSRTVPMINAMVTYVSADAVNEQDPRKAMMPQASRGAFVVRVRLDEGDLQGKVKNFHPQPGMPADVFIKTGTRTFSEYLLKPLRDSLTHAFRES